MSTGRQISKAESGLIISGWRDSGVVIKSQCEIDPVAFSFRGRIVEFSDSRRVRFLNVDGRAEFASILETISIAGISNHATFQKMPKRQSAL